MQWSHLCIWHGVQIYSVYTNDVITHYVKIIDSIFFHYLFKQQSSFPLSDCARLEIPGPIGFDVITSITLHCWCECDVNNQQLI